MNREVFLNHLQIASRHCAEFTRAMVTEDLPDQFLYLVIPNESFDGNPLHADEMVFPDDTLKPGRMPAPRNDTDVVDYLWRDGRIPEWIDVFVRRVASGYTFLKLSCCGRFTANDELLYYRNSDCPPFGIKGTVLPPHWKSLEASGKFSINWREN